MNTKSPKFFLGLNHHVHKEWSWAIKNLAFDEFVLVEFSLT
jgi:hypothetical protein